jgi:hypothetical protein
VVATVAVVLCLDATRHAVGTMPDSGAYLGAAHNLVDGRGLTTPFTLAGSQYSPRRAVAFHGAVPLTQFPPLFPLAVGLFGSVGLAVADAARILNAVLLGLNLVLVGVLTRRVIPSSIAPVAVMALVLVGPVSGELGVHQSWLLLHALALSEPLFITLTLLTLLTLSRYLGSGRGEELLAASLLAGAGLLTRYVGISLVIAGVAAVIFWGPGDRRTRLRRAGLFAGVGLSASAAWALYDAIVQHGSGLRSLHVHTSGLGGIRNVLAGWLTPADWPGVLRDGVLVVAVLIIISALMGLGARRRGRDGTHDTFRLVLAFSCIYIVVVVLNREFVDATGAFDDRIFAPIQALFYVLLVGSIWQLVTNRRRARDRRTVNAYLGLERPRVEPATLVCVAVCLVLALPALNLAGDAVDQGPPTYGLASPIQRALRRLPADTLIATDAPEAVFLSSGRASVIVPSGVNAITGQRNTGFQAELAQLVGLVARRRGTVVLVGGPTVAIGHPDLARAADFARVSRLRRRRRFPGGATIFGVDGPR